jgi:protocatechuate 3,4-dioxygenase beta subunit
MTSENQSDVLFTRRDVLFTLGSVMGIATLATCGIPNGPNEKTAAGATKLTSSACHVTPEGEIGPYFADDSANGFFRNNILANIDGTAMQSGIPLALTLYIVDGENACKPMPDVQVDIWHCNANGVYSDIAGQNTAGQTWLRGYQLSDSDGRLIFNTIIPGWYPGRTTHIHLRIRSRFNETASVSDSSNTTQLFFPQSTIDMINKTVAPYDTKGANTTTNQSDQVFTPQTAGQMLLPLSGDNTNGYRSSITISLPVAG